VDPVASNRVLLVEDDLDVRDSLQDLLESEGLDVIPAANGKQAIDFLTLNDPP
jgi:CheY-like chemotaxis protein